MSAEPPILKLCAPAPDDVSHQASCWFALMQGGSATEADRQALAEWIGADPQHAQAYAELEQLWAATALLAQPVAPAAPVQLSRRRFVGLGMTACAAAVTASATTLWFKGVGSPFADLQTAVGERRVVQFPDGSSVELAGNTALNVDFSATKRSLELLQGEAFFSVLPDAASDLTVSTPAGRVVAREGEFCVSCDDSTTLLAVSRHTVQVRTAGQQTDLGEGFSLRFSATQTEAIQRAELDQVLAWRNGRLVFFDKPLLTVVNELQRWRTGKIFIADQQLAARRVSLILNLIRAIQIQDQTDASYRWRTGKIFIADQQLAARRVSLILNLNRPDQMLDVLAKALSVRMSRYTDLVTVIHAV